MYIEILAEQNNKYLQSIDINNHTFIDNHIILILIIKDCR